MHEHQLARLEAHVEAALDAARDQTRELRGCDGGRRGPVRHNGSSIAMIGSVPLSSMIAASECGLDVHANDWIGRSSDLVSS